MAIKKTVIIDVQTEQADKNLKKTKGNITELSNEFDKTKDKSSSAFSGLDKITGGAISKLKGLKGSLGGVSLGFKSVGAAIAASGIGLLVLIIAGIIQAFKSSEAGQNKFAKLMGVIGSVTGNLLDILSDLGDKIIWAFENPKQAIEDFANLIKENITNRFNGILEYIPQMSKAIKQLFNGDFSGAAETAGNAVAKVVLGTDNLTDSIRKSAAELKKFAKEVAEDSAKAAEIADKRAKADKIERNLITQRAKANRDIAELRFKTEQRDKFSAEERIELLKQASKIEDDITKKEIYAAQLRLSAKRDENALSKSTKEDLNEEANLRAVVIGLETKKLNLSKRLQTQIQAAQNEVKASLLAEAKLRQDKLDADEKIRIKQAEDEAKSELERLEKIASIQDEFRLRREDELAETELQKIELQKERKLLELEELEATEQQKADIINYYNNKANEQILKDDKKANKEKEKLDEAVANAKVNIIDRTSQLIQEIAGRDSAVGKGVAVASATISGIEGVQNAYTTASKSPITAVFPAYPAIQAGLAGAFSALQIKKILSTDATGKSGGGATTSGGVGGGASQPSAPSFNLVQGTGTNQIAESIGNQNRPIQAYVVSGSVTSAQELDRNIIESSTI